MPQITKCCTFVEFAFAVKMVTPQLVDERETTTTKGGPFLPFYKPPPELGSRANDTRPFRLRLSHFVRRFPSFLLIRRPSSIRRVHDNDDAAAVVLVIMTNLQK